MITNADIDTLFVAAKSWNRHPERC